MQELWFYALRCVAAYLLGSLSPGDLMSRAAGMNIRTLGDGNPGTRNIWKELGPRYGAATLALDVATGTAATLLLYLLGFPHWTRLPVVVIPAITWVVRYRIRSIADIKESAGL